VVNRARNECVRQHHTRTLWVVVVDACPSQCREMACDVLCLPCRSATCTICKASTCPPTT
jgi:hypothetical protein